MCTFTRQTQSQAGGRNCVLLPGNVTKDVIENLVNLQIKFVYYRT